MKRAPMDEKAWIEAIRALWGPSGAEVDLGDDACVLPAGRFALSTDTLLEHVDFECGWAPPAAVGYKALAANLSDLAAMGAAPRFFLLTLGWPPGFPEAYLEGLLEGMRALSAAEGVRLCGGDLTRSPGGLLLSITVAGEQSFPPMRRDGGRPGDLLFVGGPLGGPAEALRRFRRGERLREFDPSRAPEEVPVRALDRFYRPPSQSALGEHLAQRGLASCCIDLSDGLAADLRRLCEASGCGADVELGRVPVEQDRPPGDREARSRAAVVGGEEQVLLFAVPPDRAHELSHSPIPCYPLGRLRPASETALVLPDGSREPLPQAGFDHFVA